MMDGNELMSHASALPTLAARALPVTAGPVTAEPITAEDAELEGQALIASSERKAMPFATAATAGTTNDAVPAVAKAAPVARGASSFDAAGFLSELRANQLAGERSFLQRTQGYQPQAEPAAIPAAQAMPIMADAPPTAALEIPKALSDYAVPPAVIEPLPASAAASAPAVTDEAKKAAAVVPAAPAKPAALLEKNLIFSLGNVRYAVPMNHIIEIAELEHYTAVPNVPDFILGLTNLRGDILSLIDLNALQGENMEEIPRGSNLLVTSTEAGDLTTCLVVDRVHGVAAVNPEQIQHFDKMTNNGLASFTRGYVSEGSNLLCLLDIESLLRSLELQH